ncbi:MAG: hypothetical protein WA989_17005 [Henriciella sp.]|uniref:hypothetical protein n=1 Tax=Henriciella sp. TaxID=1968823 RepID=UPI003C752532
MKRGWYGLVAALLAALIAGCATSYGTGTLAPAGYGYNTAIAQSHDQQLLLNLVRLRYRDTVVFMDVTSVTTQHQYTAGLSAENAVPFQDAGSGASLIIPNAAYTETPTITYSPVTGADFATNLLSPISAETIVLLANSGWSIERLMACCVERIGSLSNAPSASGPTPGVLPDNKPFRDLAQLLRRLQTEEKVYVAQASPEEGRAPVSRLSIDTEPGPDCEALRFYLSAPGCEVQYDLVPRGQRRSEQALLIQTRTVLGALYALSHAVDVPEAHASAGFVTTSLPAGAETQTWEAFLGHQFSVRSGPDEPSQSFVKINYRGHWFWIDDSDLDSKTTFSLILFLLSLQSAASQGATPLLTIGSG